MGIEYPVKLSGPTKKHNGKVYLFCRCRCGKEFWAERGNLNSGNTKGCGCLRFRHGHASRRKRPSRTYVSWYGMIARTTNPKSGDWKHYGVKGVKVCGRWRNFKSFLEDMGERPAGKTIDRINPFGNYEPSNCRWATPRDQARNKR